MEKPRLVFMGTPAFSAGLLEAILKTQKYDVCAVYTQPPRKAGRGYRLQKSPVQECAEKYNLPVETPFSLKLSSEQAHFSSLNADLAVVVAYGLILPKPILEAPLKGCMNVHTSLLPRWRGAAPIQHAIWAGDKVTGVSLMKLDEGMDTGPIYSMQEIPVAENETTVSLYKYLQQVSERLLLECLPSVLEGSAQLSPQPEEGVTYAPKITKEMGKLDWTKSASELVRQVRAFMPTPGCWFLYKGQRLRVFEAEAIEQQKNTLEPGKIVSDSFHISCRNSIFVPKVIQKSGGKALPVQEFLKGFSISLAEKL
jgi:methionyl-tRNA formyltransferase